MTAWACLFAAVVAFGEIVRVLAIPAAFGALARCGRRSTRLIARRGVSEWAKERAMGLMAQRLFGLSLRAGGLLAFAAAPVAALALIDRFTSIHPWRLLGDWRANLWLLAATTAYAVARRRLDSRAGGGERLMQRLTLGSPAVTELSFDLEVRRYGRAAAAAPDHGAPVFVAGLARAGTSVLTRALHAGGVFASPTYRDLPLPLAPNGWAQMTRKATREIAAHERGHGDGLLHDLDSPEALEEVFWLHAEGARYRSADGLEPVAPEADSIAAFRRYVALLRLRHGKARYLSKNNNNVLRLPALALAFPDAILLHPFRDPLQQAASLLNQHRRARDMAVQDPFSRTFMGWLGHHEFGPDHRPFRLPDAPLRRDDPNGIDYWLRLWISVHRSLLVQPPQVRVRQLFIDYDRLCLGHPDLGASLAERLRLDQPVDLRPLRPAPFREVRGADPALIAKAREVHDRLRVRDVVGAGRASRGADPMAQSKIA